MLYRVRRRVLSQNFIYSRTLIKLLVRNSSIGPEDIVLEIGPGKGFITAELLKKVKKVVAMELDRDLVLHLKRVLGQHPNLKVHKQDFLKFNLPSCPYKVFANIPFSIEGEVIRKLLDSSNPPQDSYLVVDKRLALRLSGIPSENQFSLKYKPWFDFSIFYYFKRSDFIPQPKVEGVMWRITRKKQPLLPPEKRKSWERFVELGFGQGEIVRKNLRKILSKEQSESLQSRLGFSLKARPSSLSLNQWLKIYKRLQQYAVA